MLERGAHGDRVVGVPLDRERVADLLGGDDPGPGSLVTLAEGLLSRTRAKRTEQDAAPVHAGRSRLDDVPAARAVMLPHRDRLGSRGCDALLRGDVADILLRRADLGGQLRR